MFLTENKPQLCASHKILLIVPPRIFPDFGKKVCWSHREFSQMAYTSGSLFAAFSQNASGKWMDPSYALFYSPAINSPQNLV